MVTALFHKKELIKKTNNQMTSGVVMGVSLTGGTTVLQHLSTFATSYSHEDAYYHTIQLKIQKYVTKILFLN